MNLLNIYIPIAEVAGVLLIVALLIGVVDRYGRK